MNVSDPNRTPEGHDQRDASPDAYRTGLGQAASSTCTRTAVATTRISSGLLDLNLITLYSILEATNYEYGTGTVAGSARCNVAILANPSGLVLVPVS